MLPVLAALEGDGAGFLAGRVHGRMPVGSRQQVLQPLGARGDARLKIISNCRVLGEGVDVPAVDLVAFLDAKSSHVDILQSIARASRVSPGKAYGHVLVMTGEDSLVVDVLPHGGSAPLAAPQHASCASGRVCSLWAAPHLDGVRAGCCSPGHGLGSSSGPPFKPPIPAAVLTMQVLRAFAEGDEELREAFYSMAREQARTGRMLRADELPAAVQRLMGDDGVELERVLPLLSTSVTELVGSWERMLGLLLAYREREGH